MTVSLDKFEIFDKLVPARDRGGSSPSDAGGLNAGFSRPSDFCGFGEAF